VIVRCRVCQELILPSARAATVGRTEEAFLPLMAECTQHAAETHPEIFKSISVFAGTVVASLALELFESQDPEVGKLAAAMRTDAVATLRDLHFSEVKRGFEVRPSETPGETDNPN
jgi:hypothetical protein